MFVGGGGSSLVGGPVDPPPPAGGGGGVNPTGVNVFSLKCHVPSESWTTSGRASSGALKATVWNDRFQVTDPPTGIDASPGMNSIAPAEDSSGAAPAVPSPGTIYVFASSSAAFTLATSSSSCCLPA